MASTSEATAQLVARACASAYFRPYTNDDVVGVELCGAVKNVIALAVGISQGRGLGYNTMATVITRGLVEITRLGLALGADADTFPGLAGLGDLMATCASPDSRNHTLGGHIGRGHDPRRGDLRHRRHRGGREVVPVRPGARHDRSASRCRSRRRS